MIYREGVSQAKKYKEKYADGIERLIISRQQEFAQKRGDYSKDIFRKADRYREDLRKMLGWPLTEDTADGIVPVKATKLAQESGYTIYRMSFEILDGLELTGLYFELDGAKKRPLVLVQHGGLGSPELISGIYGSTNNYNQMLERVIGHGVHAFAPQLLLWSEDKGERIQTDARLKRVGSSITAVELYGLMRILDYFEVQDTVSNFGMVGLSYGGFYTLLLAALDTRIQSSISCSFFNTRDEYAWPDWTWWRSAETSDDVEMACLVYPRKLCIEVGTRDEAFDGEYAKKSIHKLMQTCQEVGTEWLSVIMFDGTHEFCRDDGPICSMVNDLCGEGTTE